jgi:hypothetical protein
MIRLHFGHFCRSLGEAFPLPELTLRRLQEYIDGWARKGLSPITLRKDVTTIRAAWNWGGPMGLTSGQFPRKGLRDPKANEKPPFRTWAEIERATAAGGDEGERWEYLYLTLPEIADLLAYVKGAATQPFVYPMFSLATHTGARRSVCSRAGRQASDLPVVPSKMVLIWWAPLQSAQR